MDSITMQQIIYITSRRLLPLDSGDKLLTFNILKRLSKKRSIHLINLNEGSEYSAEELDTISHLSTTFNTISYKNEHSLFKKLKSILLNKMYWKVKIDNPEITVEIMNIIKHNASSKSIIWDHLRSTLFFSDNDYKNTLIEHNNEAEIIRSRMSKSNNFIEKFILSQQSKKTDEHIHNVHKHMEKVITLNENDFKTLYDENPNKYEIMKHLLLDFSHKVYEVKNHTETLKVLFVGSLDWYPNTEGIEWFIENVMPILDKNAFNYELNIVGRNPSEQFVNYIKSKSNIILNVNVPSIEEFYLKSDIFIIPIQNGSGINIKVLEAFSYGIPMVMTNFSKRGYDKVNFINDSDSEEEFANNLMELKDFNKRAQLHKDSLAYYENYQIESNSTLNHLF